MQPYPDVDSGKWLVSSDGGQEPKWSGDGQKLFFLSPAGLMETDVNTDGPFSAQTPSIVLGAESYVLLVAPAREYDVSPDGERFLVVQQPAAGAANGEPDTSQIVIVTNWIEELKQRVPTG